MSIWILKAVWQTGPRKQSRLDEMRLCMEQCWFPGKKNKEILQLWRGVYTIFCLSDLSSTVLRSYEVLNPVCLYLVPPCSVIWHWHVAYSRCYLNACIKWAAKFCQCSLLHSLTHVVSCHLWKPFCLCSLCHLRTLKIILLYLYFEEISITTIVKFHC